MADFDSERDQIGILIPAYEANLQIASIVTECRQYLPRVVVIDDGSSDHTADLAQQAGAHVLRHQKNFGKGRALQTGFRYAGEHGWSACLTLDADGQHSPQDIPRFIDCFLKNPAALLVGQRQWKQMPYPNRFNRLLGMVFLSARVGFLISDTQCGFRLYPTSCLRRIKPRHDRYEFESEILLLAAKQKIPVFEVPIQTLYPCSQPQQKHFRPWRDTWRIIFMFFRSLRPRWARERL